MPKVFISYRRSDTTPGYASWIYDRLAETFGADSVFMDIDSLPLGVDFVEQLERSLHQTDVALILIGPNWLAASDESGARRLDDPDDFVRLEVAAALRAETRVIPVLVDGARMPAGHELPEELGFLARRQALVFVRHGGGAIRDLVNAIRDADSARARPAEHAPPSEQAPAQGSERGVPPQAGPAAPAPRSRGARRRAIPLAVGAGVVAAGIVAVVVASGGGSGKPGGASPSGQASGSRAITVGNSPDAVSTRQATVWVANAGDGTVTRIDEPSGQVLGTVRYASHSGAAAPISLWQRVLWVGDSADGTVDRIDPSSGKMIGSPISVSGPPCAMNVQSGSLWVANFNATITRIVTQGTGAGTSAQVRTVIHLASGPKRLSLFNGSLWVSNQDNGTITRIDPTTGRVLATASVGGHPSALGTFQGSLWVADLNRNTVTRLDPASGKPVGNPVQVGRGPKRMAGAQSSLWIANSRDGTVTRIDANGRVLATIKVGGYPGAITTHAGVVWVGIWSRPNVQYQGPPGSVVRIDENTGKIVGT